MLMKYFCLGLGLFLFFGCSSGSVEKTQTVHKKRHQTVDEFIVSCFEAPSFSMFSSDLNNFRVKNVCAYDNLEKENSSFPFSLWMNCTEFTKKDGKLETLGGMEGPVLVDYSGSLTDYDCQKMSYKMPGDGSFYWPDIEKIFSPVVRENIRKHTGAGLSEKLEKRALKKLQ